MAYQHGTIVSIVMSNCIGVPHMSQALRWFRTQRRHIHIQQLNAIKEYNNRGTVS